jgi:hypothetical protein
MRIWKRGFQANRTTAELKKSIVIHTLFVDSMATTENAGFLLSTVEALETDGTLLETQGDLCTLVILLGR